MIFVMIGFILIYVNSGIVVLEHIREDKKLKWFDFIIAFIPIVRVLYMMIKIEVEE